MARSWLLAACLLAPSAPGAAAAQVDKEQLGAWYMNFFNGRFGDGREVELFDRNRTYAALGYGLSDTLRLQGGYMWQYTDNVQKGQLQLSLQQAF